MKHKTLEQEIESGNPLIINFWNEWCADCRKMNLLEVFLHEMYPDIKVYSINVNGDGAKYKNYRIKEYPTWIFYNRGDEVTRLQGYHHINEIQHIVWMGGFLK